jgi:ABC-2 type transport system ATP-binding protein
MDVSAPILLVERLRKSYGVVAPVEGVSFQVAPGEIVGLLGPNGAGKTTAINMVSTCSRQRPGPSGSTASTLCEALQRTNFAAVYAPLPGNLTGPWRASVMGGQRSRPPGRSGTSRAHSNFEGDPMITHCLSRAP